MKRFRSFFSLLLLTVFMTACGGGPQAQAGVVESNLLVSTSGTVRLRRYEWNKYVSVGAGAQLYPNDLLDVQGSATILCAQLVVKIMTASGKPPCPENRGAFSYDEARFGSTQRGTSTQIPYIIYPRKTLVLDTHPLLMWHATNAAQYDVSIVASNGTVIWHNPAVKGTSIQYPTTEPALKPGVDYLLVIKDGGKSSEDDTAKGLGFRILSVTNRAEVEQQTTAIQALTSMDANAQKLALAVYYATWPGEDGRNLWGEAAQLLEQVAQTQNTPEIQLWLGDMFRAISLPDEAASAYEKALQLASTSGDQASQAAAQVGLWRVTGDRVHLDSAVGLYQLLGDQPEIDALRQTPTP